MNTTTTQIQTASNSRPRPRHIAWPTGEQDVVRARIAKHRAADEIIQGYGFRAGKGCAVGCSLDNYSHDEYSRVLGVDLRIARLVDRIHESLPIEAALDWPGRVAAALMPGADVSTAADQFMVWLLNQGVCAKNEHCARVATLYGQRLIGHEPAVTEWREARTAAYDAAAAYAAAYAVRRAFWTNAADALIEILSRCEVPK